MDRRIVRRDRQTFGWGRRGGGASGQNDGGDEQGGFHDESWTRDVGR
jgi:hypothetical protein